MVSTQCSVVISRNTTIFWRLDGVEVTGSWQELSAALASLESVKVKALLLPDSFSLHSVAFIEAEKKMLAKTVPFSLEDELAEDIEECHFALGSAGEGTVQVAVVNQVLLRSICQLAQEHGIAFESFKTCPMPESMAYWVPMNDQSTVLLTPDHAVVLDKRQVDTVQGVLAELPCRVAPLIDSVGVWPELSGFEADKSFFTSPLLQVDGIDLMQGEFRKGIAWGSIWRAWRMPAIAAMLLVVALIAQSWWQVSLLEARNVEYRVAIEDAYRQAFPKSRVVNPRRQMESRLSNLNGAGGSTGSNMLSLMTVLSQEPQAAGLQISAINYESRASELRIDILADNFQQVERLRSALKARGVEAELQNSSASGNKVRAKLSLKEVG